MKYYACSSARLRGITLVEAVISMLLVSVLVVTAMQATAASGAGQYKTAQRTTGRLLADALINEILPLAYEDRDATPLFGREGSESASNKATFDDVDDFGGWVESPPQDRNGTVMPGMNGWERRVVVDRVHATIPTQVVSTESGAKRIVVTVLHNGLPVATRTAIRTGAP